MQKDATAYLERAEALEAHVEDSKAKFCKIAGGNFEGVKFVCKKGARSRLSECLTTCVHDFKFTT